MQLVKPFIEQRNTSKLPWIVRNKISLVLGQPEPIARHEPEQLGPATHDREAGVMFVFKPVQDNDTLKQETM